ncbi:hypothetical protein [Streptomyces sp. NPDC001809]
MQRPNAAQLTYGSATVVLATVALLLSGTTSTLGISVVCLAGLLLGLLVAVTMPPRTTGVKTTARTPAPAAHEEARVPTARVGAGVDTRTGS